MTNILLVCAAGMSTSMLVNRMKVYAQGENISVNINALAISEAKEKIKKNEVDVVLLGPQVRFQKKEIEDVAQGLLPVAVIDMKSYGEMNGKSVLEFALALLAKNNP
ncbi:PTS sugar transporter subunit IIB [Gibbsiella quercinecans]|uniref:PTS sugar transporter subunit IIB n=1 Tax=Gibbsiella quercinecans TaxID=929813 RepID=UPI003A4DDEDC